GSFSDVGGAGERMPCAGAQALWDAELELDRAWLEGGAAPGMGAGRLVRALGFVAWPSCFDWRPDAPPSARMLASGYSKCATCHVDPSGGETLNHMGRVQSQRTLSAQWESYRGLDPDIRPAYGLHDPDWARLGGSARVLSLLKFPRETADPE